MFVAFRNDDIFFSLLVALPNLTIVLGEINRGFHFFSAIFQKKVGH